MSGMWFGVKDTCLNEIGLHAQNMIVIVGSIVNIIGGGGGRGAFMTI